VYSHALAEPALGAPEVALAAWSRWILSGLTLIALLVASRWPLAPRYLITFDEINFALSLDHFNPALHQPQPPGDPLYVFLLKLLSFGIPRVETLFLVSGLLLSTAALALLWAFGEAMLGPGRGIVAALLLLFNPVFWLSALTNPVRLCYAVGAPAVALCLFLALQRRSQLWFLIALAALGLAAGFRPDLAMMLTPLVLWTAFRLQPGWKTLATALVLFLLCVATWLPILSVATGGWRALYDVLRSYFVDQTRATSAVTGAAAGAAGNMAWEAIVWSCLGTLSWLWALPRVLRRKPIIGLHPTIGRSLLLWWFLPGLLFYAAIHVGDPDHTLAIVPATCLAGAAVLAAMSEGYSMQARALFVLAAVLLNVFLFVKPITKTARSSTIRPVRWLDRYVTGIIDTVSRLQRSSGVTVVFDERITGWRNVSYYVPDARVIVIRAQSQEAPAGWNIRHEHRETWSSTDGIIRLPACGTLAWVDPQVRARDDRGVPVGSWNYPVSFTHAALGESFQYRGFRFITTQDNCR
jgi:hypothetical protein